MLTDFQLGGAALYQIRKEDSGIRLLAFRYASTAALQPSKGDMACPVLACSNWLHQVKILKQLFIRGVLQDNICNHSQRVDLAT